MFTNRNRSTLILSKIKKAGILSLALVFCAFAGIVSEVLACRVEFSNGAAEVAQNDSAAVPRLLGAGGSITDAVSIAPAASSDDEVYNGAFDPMTGASSYPSGEWIATTEKRVIPYTQTLLENPALPAGTIRVIRQGSSGLKLFHKRTYFYKHKELYSVIISTEVATLPVEEIVEVGTYELAPGAALTYGAITSDKQYVTTPDGVRLPYQSALKVTATAYTTEGQSNTLTYTETTARVGAIAVDPSVIPLGSKLYICSTDGTWIYGIATAEDTGGSIKGAKIDLFFNTYDECIQFGRQPAMVYILKQPDAGEK